MTLEQQVVKSLKEQELLSSNINAEFDRKLTFGGRLADRVADYGGSWRFIGIFMGVLLVWIVINSIVLIQKPFDPYPFILLNLVLSCIAAIQAPIILMSQNRQEAKDRLRSEYDYRINLKAELEIRHLHEKIDHLLMNQWHRLLEIQEIQTELMEELARSPRGHGVSNDLVTPQPPVMPALDASSLKLLRDAEHLEQLHGRPIAKSRGTSQGKEKVLNSFWAHAKRGKRTGPKLGLRRFKPRKHKQRICLLQNC